MYVVSNWVEGNLGNLSFGDWYKNIGAPQDTIACPHPNVNSVCFDDPYERIHHMENNHEDTHLIDTQEQDMENTDSEQEEFYEDTNYDLITEEELENIPLEMNQNFPPPTINSGIMSIHHNDPEKILDDIEYFQP